MKRLPDRTDLTAISNDTYLIASLPKGRTGPGLGRTREDV
jgi:hypothetical protein